MTHLTLYSQTLKSDDDPEDGDIIAIGLYENDIMQRCWVVMGLREECDETNEDALGNIQIHRKNLTYIDVTPPSRDKLEELLAVILSSGDYQEIKPYKFRLFTNTEENP